jgi:hypothetical protein
MSQEQDIAKYDIRIHNGKVAWAHIESEYRDVVEEIIATLVPEGPYAYTITPMILGDGSIPHQHFVTDLPSLRRSYEDMHRVAQVRGLKAVAEIRGDWYVFTYGLGEGYVKSTGDVIHTPTVILFPTMGKSGITGELIWKRTAVGAPYTGPYTGSLAAETAILELHEAYLDCLRKGDAKGAANLHHPDAQIGIRDHVTDSGTITAFHNSDEYRSHLDQFFGRFKVRDIQIVDRLAMDWFVFAELCWIVEERGTKLRFFTADHAEVRPDGLFASRIGHGTERTAL